MKELYTLFVTFAKIGLFTFGGGMAMLPMLQKEIVDVHNWATEDELMDYYAIGQCTPGIIAVNTATFVGYKKKGITGGICATAGMVFPSFVIICIIAGFLQNFSNIEFVQQAFSAIRVVVGVLILNSVIKLAKSAVINKLCFIIALLSFLASVILTPSPIIIVVIGGILGVIFPSFGKKKNNN